MCKFKEDLIVVFLLFVALFAPISDAECAENFRIGVISATVSQCEDGYRGAEKAVAEFGDASNGGMIKHVTYPDNFMQEMETTIAQIVGLADDPLVKAIVAVEAVPGTAEAFRKVKEKRSDILCIATLPHEDPEVITSTADLSFAGDDIILGYLIPYTAKKMGAKTLVHISFPRHLSYEFFSRRLATMRVACKDLDIDFVMETAPDPLSDVGVAGAQQFMLEKVPAWIKKYGKDTAFFTTNLALCEPMIRQIAKYGGCKPDGESLLNGFPGAFGIDLSKEAGNWPAMLKRIEEATIQAGAKGRLGAWPYSLSWSAAIGLVEHAKNVIEGHSKLTKVDDIWKAYKKFTPKAVWKGRFYEDPLTGVKKKNYILAIEDFYVFGRGNLGLINVDVDERYLRITK